MRRVTVLAVEDLPQERGLAQMALRLAHQHQDMPVADRVRDHLIEVVQQAHRADGGRGQDRLAVGLVVKADIARHDRHVERDTGLADAL
jgi:hypothetical protein